MQCEKIAELRDCGQIETETLSQTGEWFLSQYPLTPALSQVAFTDWHGEGQKSIWYNSSRYRVNLFVNGSVFGIRDCHLFDENYPERYLTKVCDTPSCTFDTLPLWDGLRQSVGRESALLRLCDGSGVPLAVRTITYRQNGDVGVCTADTSIGKIYIECRPAQICLRSAKDDFMLIGDAGKKIDERTVTVKKDRAECVYKGYAYGVSVQKGTLCDRRAISENGILEIDFTKEIKA